MRATRLVRIACIAALLAPAAQAEISVERGEIRLQARAGETWAPLRPEALTGAVLNPWGDARGDGAPSLALAPVSGAWEAVWSLGGATPGLAFARYDEASDSWTTVRVPAARGASAAAGRTPSLHHDSQGNAYLLYEDPGTGQVLLSSVARDSLRVNPPYVLASPQQPGRSPDALWDGDALVVAFVRPHAPDRIEVVEIAPVWDAAGRIPDGGEGIPGIPEPIFGHSAPIGGLGNAGTLGAGSGDVAPALGNAPAQVDLDAPPPLLEIEQLAGDRLLVTWLHEGRIYWSRRILDTWSEPAWVELEDPLQFEPMRARLVEAFDAGIDPGPARDWARDRRGPSTPAASRR